MDEEQLEYLLADLKASGGGLVKSEIWFQYAGDVWEPYLRNKGVQDSQKVMMILNFC